MADQISLDLDELRHLQTFANRPRVVSLISSEIADLEKLLKENAAASIPEPTPLPVATQTIATPSMSYTTLSSFSWDQDSDKVKIYLFLEGVQEEKIVKTFNPTSFDLKFHDVQGKNYHFAISKLNKEIVPEKCKLLVKPTRVTIVCLKASKGNWLDLKHKEDKLTPKLGEDKDPMAGIMDMMKNMYEDGDEEMKKTIAKAWTEARSGKTADPLKGYR